MTTTTLVPARAAAKGVTRPRPDDGHEFVGGKLVPGGSFAEPWLQCARCDGAEQFHSSGAMVAHAHRFLMESLDEAMRRQPEVAHNELTVLGVCRCGATTQAIAVQRASAYRRGDDRGEFAA